MGKRIGWDQPPDPWALPFGRVMSEGERRRLAADHNGICRLCRRPGLDLVYEHDHTVGIQGARGLTCQLCNSGQLVGVDHGRYAIDEATRHYLMEPWHLAVRGERLSYDPVVRLAIEDLSDQDRRELNRLSWESANDFYSIRKTLPQFEHHGVAQLVQLGEFRAVLRLRYLNIRGLHNLDISKVVEPMSTFQRDHLPHVIANHAHEWAHLDGASSEIGARQ